MLITILTIATAWGSHPERHPRVPEPPKTFEKLWEDLQSVDDHVSSRALLALSKDQEKSVAFLRERMKPLRVEKGRVKQLLQVLGDADKKKAQQAFDEMLYLDPRLVLNDEEIREALVSPGSARLASLFCGLGFDYQWSDDWHWYSPNNEVYLFSDSGQLVPYEVSITVAGIDTRDRKTWVRALRAIALLESIDSRESRLILKNMATGNPDAPPTKAARLALERLEGGAAPLP